MKAAVRAAYWTPAEAAAAWNRSADQVRALCAAGKVPGAVNTGVRKKRFWLVPKGSRPRPLGPVAVGGEYAAGGVG